ncbi:glycosyltransferase family 4 protein [Candidatus Falkowbacteria bacterium]|nr:glycosyltransferase family 4 protein [Candidatus Falkowbacteria bacterium]
MKKILLVTIDFPPQSGGVARYLAGLAAALPPDRLAILAPKNKLADDRGYHYKVYRRRLVWRIWPRWWPMVRQVIKVASRERAQMLWAAQPLPVGTVTLMVSKFLRLPYIVNSHGMDIAGPLQSGGRRYNVLRRVLHGAQIITYNSEYTKRLLQRFDIPEDKLISVYPCPAALPAAFPASLQTVIERHQLSGKKVLLSVGRLVERKGHDMVIRSLPQVLAKEPNMVYLIVGDGENRQNLLNLIKTLNLAQNVILAGQVLDSELAAYYGAAMAFIMAAREGARGDVEGFGTVFLEAGNFSLPVIAGRSGGQLEAVLDGTTGLVVDPRDISAIAGAVIRLLSDASLASRLGQAGREYARQFTWEREAKKLENILS